MRVFGIDPGLTGYVCMLEGAADAPLTSLNVEFFPVPVKEGDFDPECMTVLCMDNLSGSVNLGVVERQQAFPGRGPKCPACHKPRDQQGVVSTGTTMFGYGLWMGVLTARGIPTLYVAPQDWKGPLGLDADKAKSIAKAQALFPDVDFRPLERSPKSRVPDHNKCESALLAVTARKLFLARRVK